MLDISPPAGAPPRDMLLEAVCDVYDQVLKVADHSDCPPQLQPSIHIARHAQHRDDVGLLEAALIDIAHAAITSLVRVRAVAREEPTP